jgi:hypothetical protein
MMSREMIFKLIIALGIGAIVIGFTIFWLAPNQFAFPNGPSERDWLAMEALKDVGVVVIGIAVIEFVWALLGGAPTENALRSLVTQLNTASAVIRNDVDSIKQEVSTVAALAASGRRCGLENIGMGRDDLRFDYPNFIAQVDAAMEKIQICGATLNFLYANDSALNALVERAKHLPVEILLPDDDNTMAMAMFQDRFGPNVRLNAKDLADRITQSNSAIKLLRLKNKAMTMSMVRIDDMMLVTPYLFSRQTTESPRFLIRDKKTPLFETYENEFAELSRT